MLSIPNDIKTYNKSMNFLDLKWILFLGVLPIDSAALTFFLSDSIGNYISLFLNFCTIIGAFIGLINVKSIKERNRLSQKYIVYFGVLAFVYFCAVFVEQIEITRFFSLICLLGYYLFVICCFKNVDKLIRSINKALLFIILISLALYILGNENVMYIENASKTVFKGITSNRNSYSEISLFYIATNFYIWRKDKKHFVWRSITTLIAVFTTIMTNSATSIICTALLFVLMMGCVFKKMRKLYSFNVFSVVYIVVFTIVVLIQNSDLAIMKNITTLFDKTSSLTGRTDIWEVSINYISKSPLFGFGYDTNVLLSQGIIENDPHNGILYIALTQGIVGIIALVCMISFLVRIDRNEDIKRDDAYISMFIFVLVWLVKGLVESVFSYTHFVFWCSIIVLELQHRKSLTKQ